MNTGSNLRSVDHLLRVPVGWLNTTSGIRTDELQSADSYFDLQAE